MDFLSRTTPNISDLLGQILQQAPIYSMEVVYQQILLKRDVHVVADKR